MPSAADSKPYMTVTFARNLQYKERLHIVTYGELSRQANRITTNLIKYIYQLATGIATERRFFWYGTDNLIFFAR